MPTSFAHIYMKGSTLSLEEIKNARNFMLDSGVFTMINSKKNVPIERYADEYADFVRENRIGQYVELDVDQIIGVKKTRALRDRIEKRVGWRSIPVWHTIRGRQSFLDDTKDYDYIALGYFLTEGLSPSLTEKYARSFVDAAHENECRIHGLGFTKTELLPDIPFDSVDSSTWSSAPRYGKISVFNGKIIRNIQKKEGTRLTMSKEAARYSFSSWRKYQDYAYKYLKPIWQ